MAIKQTLTPQEVICAAYGRFILGLEQQQIAAMLGINQGRVSEACQVVFDVAERYREAYAELKKEENANVETQPNG